MVKQLGLEDRVAGRGPPMHTHHTPGPPAPPKVTPPTEVVTEENVQDWIDFWKEAPQHATSEDIIGRFLRNVAFMTDKIHKNTCFYCAEAAQIPKPIINQLTLIRVPESFPINFRNK